MFVAVQVAMMCVFGCSGTIMCVCVWLSGVYDVYVAVQGL